MNREDVWVADGGLEVRVRRGGVAITVAITVENIHSDVPGPTWILWDDAVELAEWILKQERDKLAK